MKKIYMIPTTNVLAVGYESLMAANSYRLIDGGPQDEGGLPGTVGETDGETDPFSDDEGNGHGQGSGGGGTRGKIGGGLWDDIDDDY